MVGDPAAFGKQNTCGRDAGFVSCNHGSQEYCGAKACRETDWFTPACHAACHVYGTENPGDRGNGTVSHDVCCFCKYRACKTTFQ